MLFLLLFACGGGSQDAEDCSLLHNREALEDCYYSSGEVACEESETGKEEIPWGDALDTNTTNWWCEGYCDGGCDGQQDDDVGATYCICA